MVKKTGALILAILLLCPPNVVQAREQNLEMDVRVVVGRDASLTVTERIAFFVERDNAELGPVRNVPVVHREKSRRVISDFQILSATLNGTPVPYESRQSGKNMKIRLRDHSFLTRGTHEYILTYRMTRRIVFHGDTDELRWSVTDREGIFPVEKASFRVELPPGASVTEYDASAGRSGSREKSWERDPDGVFRTTRGLRWGEEFTVSLVWPGGFVVPPPKTWKERFWAPWGRGLFLLSAALIVLWYGGWWFRRGAPKPGLVSPLPEPPHDFEPSYIGYIRKLRFDSNLLLADLIDLAIRGYLVLELGKSSITASLTEKNSYADAAGTCLSPPRQAFLKKLSEIDASVPFGTTGYLQDLMVDALPSFYGIDKRGQKGNPLLGRPALMRWNRKINRSGLLLFVPFLGLLWQGGEHLFDAIFIASLLVGFTGKLAVPPVENNSPRTTTMLALASCFVLIPLLLWLRDSLLNIWMEDPLVTASSLAALGSALFFAIRMPARTYAGRKLLDEVEGFELYLRNAEKHHMETLFPSPEKDAGKSVPQLSFLLFERLLPYAVALGIPQTWTEHFASVLENSGYQPDWLRGPASLSAASFSVSGFISDIRNMKKSISPPGGGTGRLDNYRRRPFGRPWPL
ncbi:MAG: DUF2207 domain-containing protein [Synergistaceae bacterium]|jgi:hypothetical protein|nr:DUF2207 domain-containing protein [Synergistaceae bacterium]